ncbi:8-oxo-dGTP diphosphatase [Alkalicoccobacillus murimartini]|uniref:8-oxo-dGTP diphosphatase n=1 Tax=Alkalicoccobacillus murimartini TaxID=171685 RepID=A0ABT9YGT4_9BACI|nr:8-oxo-dGTP diphosphatase [Alkalicoccobacillus murimartini]MDQ0206700.1 8-oxo-dGTP diphosphatase [Alkalicoccobacillus murimartini]
MQRVTNCAVIKDDKILLLQKPSRGWWVAPGGKMESGETIKESATRECREETGLSVIDPELNGVYTIVIEENGQTVSEWMLFTFKAVDYSGTLLSQSPEGTLKWWKCNEVAGLPMAEGDQAFIEHVLNGKGIMFGTFYYTPDYQLLRSRLDPAPATNE